LYIFFPVNLLKRVSTIVQPTGPEFNLCVRLWECPPSFEIVSSFTPICNNHSKIYVLSSTKAFINSFSCANPLDSMVSFLNSSYESISPFLFCTLVTAALIPDVAFAELPPLKVFLSINKIILFGFLEAKNAAVPPARPLPTINILFFLELLNSLILNE